MHQDGFRLDASLAVPAGAVVALLGPNGAGKSTALRALAGLRPLADGRIVLAGRVLDDPAAGVFVAPQRRGVGVVFQDYLLFPHLDVVDNVAFGPRCQGVGRAAARRGALEWLARFGLADAAGSRPRELSGGQAQRVALARALACGPRLLLLDEPLAALDAGTRPAVRARLRGYLTASDAGGVAAGAADLAGTTGYAGVTGDAGATGYEGTTGDAGAVGPVRATRAGGRRPATIVVTHDPLDAAVLADRIVVIEDGQVVQEGDVAEITRRPRTEYVARLAGLNLYRGSGAGSTVTLAGGATVTVAERVAGETFVAFPPSAVAVFARRAGDGAPPVGSPRNVWPTTLDGIERYGDRVRLRLVAAAAPGGAAGTAGVGAAATGGIDVAATRGIDVAADVTPQAVAELRLAPGEPVYAVVKAAEIRVYPAEVDPR